MEVMYEAVKWFLRVLYWETEGSVSEQTEYLYDHNFLEEQIFSFETILFC